jgi:REP element-mobilizing transposase RayT
MGPGWIHLTARVSPALPSLIREDVAAWVWTHLREAFPSAIAAVLMPDHPHLITPSDDPNGARCRLARLLGQAGRRFGVAGQASLVPEAKPIRGRHVLARQVRYVALNPCRKRLARCPLAWRWSTHRDIVGASVDPWVTAERLARALDRPCTGFVAQHHAYVSGDPDARVEGTPLPLAATPTKMANLDLQTIAAAACAALRLPVTAIRAHGRARALFVGLAIEQGWRSTALLADVCGCGVRTIERRVAEIPVDPLAAARLCLGDARLRVP